jgi:hypothetical protein
MTIDVPALGIAGEICWVAVRNPLENPDHSVDSGPGKPRPAILAWPVNHRWAVIGTTTLSSYGNGSPRMRIPPELWEHAHRSLGGRPGYLWGEKAPVVVARDVGDHIGWASAQLRAFAIRPITNVRPTDRSNFLRLRADELANQ